MKLKREKLLRKTAYGFVFRCGILVAGLLAVPTAVLLVLISGVWKGTGLLLEKLDSL